MLSEEIVEKTENFAVRIGEISKDALKNAVNKLLEEFEKFDKSVMSGTKKEKHGRTTFKELSQKNDGLTTIELSNPHLRMLDKTMKKHGVDFAPVKDGKGKYTLFFKGKDKDCIAHALKDYAKKLIKLGKTNPSIRMALDSAKQEVQTRSKNIVKEKNLSRGGLER
jgi:hypothetical protein